MKSAKWLVVAAVLGLATLVSSQASAAVFSYTTTLGAWALNPVNPGDEFDGTAVAAGFDKTFTFESATFAPTQGVTFSYNSVSGSFSVLLTPLQGLPGGSNLNLYYNVEILPTVLAIFKTVELDVIHFSDVTTATKLVHRDAARTLLAAGPMVSLNGVPDGEVFNGAYKKIWVSDNYTTSASGSAFGLNNVFTQQAVPEPTTLALWGGMMGLGLLYSRRRAAKR